MKKLLEQIQNIPDIILNKPTEDKKIIICQQELHHNNFPMLPKNICHLLQLTNGINYNGCVIFGIHTAGLDDIISENLSSYYPTSNLILGKNEFDLLTWNSNTSEYEIIDKSDGEVLISYSSEATAIKYILKIDDIQ